MPAGFFVFENYGEWEGKSGGLACARLRLTDHICPREHDRDHRGLDRRRRGIAKFGNRLHDLVTQV